MCRIKEIIPVKNPAAACPRLPYPLLTAAANPSNPIFQMESSVTSLIRVLAIGGSDPEPGPTFTKTRLSARKIWKLSCDVLKPWLVTIID